MMLAFQCAADFLPPRDIGATSRTRPEAGESRPGSFLSWGSALQARPARLSVWRTPESQRGFGTPISPCCLRLIGFFLFLPGPMVWNFRQEAEAKRGSPKRVPACPV